MKASVIEIKGGIFPSEFNEDNEFTKIAIKILGHRGACLGSKSGYSKANSSHLVVFNANVIVNGTQKIWHGDLDLTLRNEEIKKLAKKLKCWVYVLYEMDARFRNRESPDITSPVYVTDGFGELIHKYGYRNKKGILCRRK